MSATMRNEKVKAQSLMKVVSPNIEVQWPERTTCVLTELIFNTLYRVYAITRACVSIQ